MNKAKLNIQLLFWRGLCVCVCVCDVLVMLWGHKPVYTVIKIRKQIYTEQKYKRNTFVSLPFFTS